MKAVEDGEDLEVAAERSRARRDRAATGKPIDSPEYVLHRSKFFFVINLIIKYV